jgi:hypothetical protein
MLISSPALKVSSLSSAASKSYKARTYKMDKLHQKQSVLKRLKHLQTAAYFNHAPHNSLQVRTDPITLGSCHIYATD